MPRAEHVPIARLTNRSAWLSLTAALFFFVGLLTFGTAVQKTEDIALRAASGTPFVVAVGGVMWARMTRAKLRALRRDADLTHPTPASVAVSDANGLPGRDEGSSATPAARS